MKRKVELADGHYYHVFNKSIAGFKIFNNQNEYVRMLNTIRYYRFEDPPVSLSQFIDLKGVQFQGVEESLLSLRKTSQGLVSIVAYCLMPTHLHLILKQSKCNGIATFMRLILNSYARYFNIKLKRKGPLWQGRFGNVLIESEEQLYHLTRYLHLNPVSANLVKRPEQWLYSSYSEYIGENPTVSNICCFEDIWDIQPAVYKNFVDDQIDYQRELAFIKRVILE